MCNAWNHALSCRCGWGGLGHLGRPAGAGHAFAPDVVFKTYRELLRGSTIPNARCPVCRQSVFFYQSPNGGRVFFDDLGPPWPKHPCTSSSYTASVFSRIATPLSAGAVVRQKAARDGWKPFLCEQVGLHRPRIQRVVGRLDGVLQSFYVVSGTLSEGAPYFVRKLGNEWWLSTLIDEGAAIAERTVRAYEFYSQITGTPVLPPVTAAAQRPGRLSTPKRKSGDKSVLPAVKTRKAEQRARQKGRQMKKA
jgi:hypothetical protein